MGPDRVPDKYVSQINWLRIKVLDFFLPILSKKNYKLGKVERKRKKILIIILSLIYIILSEINWKSLFVWEAVFLNLIYAGSCSFLKKNFWTLIYKPPVHPLYLYSSCFALSFQMYKAVKCILLCLPPTPTTLFLSFYVLLSVRMKYSVFEIGHKSNK